VVLLSRHFPLLPGQAVDLEGRLADGVQLFLLRFRAGDRRAEPAGEFMDLEGKGPGVPVVRKGEGGNAYPPVLEDLHERLREAAVPPGDGDHVGYAVRADDPVDPLDPAAAVPGESVGFRETDVLGGPGRGDEEVVEIDRGVPAGEQDLDGDRGGESDARDVSPPG